MNQKSRTLVFLLSIIVGLINKFIVSFDNSNFFSLFMNCYFNDLVGCCGYCAYCDMSSVLFISRELNPLCIIVITICSGFFWEYVTPLFRHDTVSDPMDIVAYSFGALVYLIIRCVAKRSQVSDRRDSEMNSNC